MQQVKSKGQRVGGSAGACCKEHKGVARHFTLVQLAIALFIEKPSQKAPGFRAMACLLAIGRACTRNEPLSSPKSLALGILFNVIKLFYILDAEAISGTWPCGCPATPGRNGNGKARKHRACTCSSQASFGVAHNQRQHTPAISLSTNQPPSCR